jgi:integrase
MKGSVYKDTRGGKNNGTWYYSVDLGRKSDGGRNQKKKGGFRTKKDAEAALVEVISAVNHGTYTEPSNQLYKDYLPDWFDAKRKLIERLTAEGYESYMRLHIVPNLGSLPLSRITPTDVQRFINSLSDKGLAAATIKRIYNVVNNSLQAAVKLKAISENPAKSIIGKPKVQKKEICFWNEDEVKCFLDTAKLHSRLHIAFTLALLTGMRQGEILGLRWADIDLEKGIIHIRQTLSHDGKELRAGAKSASGVRAVAIDGDTIKELKKHRAIQTQERWSAGSEYIELDLVVCTSIGKMKNPRDLMKTMFSLLEKAKVSKTTFHGLRHTHASMLLKLGVHPKIVQERLGHSSIQVTLDLYSHLYPNMQSDAADAIGKRLFGS